MFLLLIHPAVQLFAILLALYALYLGIKRFRFLHLSQQTVFPWKHHVASGLISLVTMLFGMVMGMVMVYTHWGIFLMTGIHGRVALVMIPFLLFGITSGLYMNARKKKRKALPLIHALNNLFIIALSLAQAFTGWRILKNFVLGI